MRDTRITIEEVAATIHVAVRGAATDVLAALTNQPLSEHPALVEYRLAHLATIVRWVRKANRAGQHRWPNPPTTDPDVAHAERALKFAEHTCTCEHCPGYRPSAS